MTRDDQSRAKPTLEDLLRLKRAERPDAAFWQDFERGMRKKQLAAIVEPKPWWLGLSILSRKLGAIGIPVSAGAAAILALVVMRVSPVGSLAQSGSESSPKRVVSKLSSDDQVSPITTPKATVATVVLPHTQIAEQPEKSYAVTSLESLAATNSAKSGSASGDGANQRKTGALSVGEVNSRQVLASTTSVAAIPTPRYPTSRQSPMHDTSATEQAVTESNGSALASAGDEIPVEKSELNQRQARLLSAATDLEEGKSLANVRERVLHRLADEEARYASISRVGVNADRLSLKF